jgi:hypothetical protein
MIQLGMFNINVVNWSLVQLHLEFISFFWAPMFQFGNVPYDSFELELVVVIFRFHDLL